MVVLMNIEAATMISYSKRVCVTNVYHFQICLEAIDCTNEITERFGLC